MGPPRLLSASALTCLALQLGGAEAVCLVLWDPALCHDGNLTLFPQTDLAESPACLDGSDYGVYFRGNPRSTKWTVFLEGGGWCAAGSLATHAREHLSQLHQKSV